MDQVLPTSIWNTLCPGLKLYEKSYLIETPALHPPFYKPYVIYNLGIQQNLFTAFHLRTDSQTKRMNAWIEQYLRP